MESGTKPTDFEKARRIFEKIPGYKDADQKAEACIRHIEEIETAREKKTRTIIIGVAAAVIAIIIFINTPLWDRLMGKTVSEAISSGEEKKDQNNEKTNTTSNSDEVVAVEKAVPGNVVEFGNYQWLVLEANEEDCLLVMFHAEKHEETRHGAYHDKLEDITWADCSLRSWLNGAFLEKGFSEEDRKKILLQHNVNPGSTIYGTDGGEDTDDYVTLLTPDQYQVYKSICNRIAMNFWLRTPGATQQAAQFVSHRKEIMDYGYAVNSDQFYVVPVIQIAVEH